MRKVLKTLMVFGGLALLVGLWSAARAQWPPVKDPMRMANERSAFRHSEAGTGTATATPEVIIVPTINLTREAQLRAALLTTPTPSPTSTLGPIPTRRPGPTATAYPTATLFPTPAATPSAAAPAGEIWFNIYDEQKQSRVLRRVPVDRDGKALAAGVEIPWPGISGSMYLSPDGHYWLIGIAGMSPGAGQTYVYDLTTGKTVEIPSPYGAGSIFYGWHPDSRHVLLATIEDRVAVVNVETLAATDLFPPDPQWGIYTWSAGFSPDGQRVAFAKKGGLWISSTAGGDAAVLLDEVGDFHGWSPDGRYLLHGGGPGKKWEAGWPAPEWTTWGSLWLHNADGTNPRNLAGTRLVPYTHPVWSPDSQWIAYSGWDVGYGWTDAGYVDPCEPKSKEEARDFKPARYCNYKGVGVYVVHVATGAVRRMADGKYPSWSPDSRLIHFGRLKDGTVEDWMVRVDGSGLRQVMLNGQAANIHAWRGQLSSWSPASPLPTSTPTQ